MENNKKYRIFVLLLLIDRTAQSDCKVEFTLATVENSADAIGEVQKIRSIETTHPVRIQLEPALNQIGAMVFHPSPDFYPIGRDGLRPDRTGSRRPGIRSV